MKWISYHFNISIFLSGLATKTVPDVEEEESIANTSFSLEKVDDRDARLMTVLIAGWSPSEIEMNLPRILRIFSDDLESLKIVLLRIIRARPPPLTKATLLSALHRYISIVFDHKISAIIMMVNSIIFV